LKDLFEFQRVYPNMQDMIEEKINGFGLNFRIYIRRSLNKLAEAGDRFGASQSPADHPTTKSDETAESYKERLSRLQQMFNSSTSLTSAAPVEQLTVFPSSATETSAAVLQPMEVACGEEENVEPPQTASFPSVDTLKERLARMRSAIGMSEI
jgi:hypothetical protein